jgi:ATP-dependent DNA helicase RecQ
VEAKDYLCKAIEAVIATKENFTEEYIIDILLGNETDEILAHRHDELDVFASLENLDEKVLAPVIKQALLSGYFDKDIDVVGVLKVTKSGKAFLKSPTSFQIVEDNEFDDVEEEEPVQNGGACAVDPGLYEMIKDLRKRMAKEMDVPPYVIFQDASLEAMATIYPQTIKELENIPGVGAGKAKRYGEEFCKLIKKHCEDNEIERPEDLRIRTVANKSKLKVSIIQSIDRKVMLDDLAEAKGIDFSELLDEIEAIVYSGTKINIDYFIEEILDDEHIEDIFGYFKDSETDDIEDAIEELGADYSEEEIRLVRIKFISEMAN